MTFKTGQLAFELEILLILFEGNKVTIQNKVNLEFERK